MTIETTKDAFKRGQALAAICFQMSSDLGYDYHEKIIGFMLAFCVTEAVSRKTDVDKVQAREGLLVVINDFLDMFEEMYQK